MRVALVYNPIAGRGRARREASTLRARLSGAGIDADVVESSASMGSFENGSRPDAMVVLGGDGTVHAMAALATSLNIPIYQFPLGTENLFAREFGMNRRFETLTRAIERGRVERVDVAHCNGRSFLLMCSVGPDANIIHRLAANRRGSIHHLSYIPHIAAELARPRIGLVSVTVDGDRVVADQRGLVVVANSRQYALRVDPAKDASMRDGQLDVRFFPVSKRSGLVKWMGLSRMRLQDRVAGSIAARGAEVVIESAEPLLHQVDGEAGTQDGPTPTGSWALRFGVEAGVLPVLSP